MDITNTMLENSETIKRYVNAMVNAIKTIDPDIPKDQVVSITKKLIKNQGMSPPVYLDNNYTGEFRESTLLSVLDWTYKRKPIIAGNGTFYKPQSESYNPAAVMLSGMLQKRKEIKKRLFKVADASSRLYKDLDRSQGNQKINANSYYGGSGAKTSSFYSKYSGPATTLSAQSVISTTENLFESFLAGNYDFLDLNELSDWIEWAMRGLANDEVDLSKLKPVKPEKLVARFYAHLIMKDGLDLDILKEMVSRLPDPIVSYLYYKNNMQEFIEDHAFIKELILSIFTNIVNLPSVNPKDPDWIKKVPKEYQDEYREKNARAWNIFVNHKYFINPNNPPEEIKKDLETLCHYMMQYVYVRYMAFDRIYRLKNFMRDTVTIIDTDSNILSLDILMRYLIKTFFNEKGDTYGRSYMNNVYIGINMITYFITTAVEDILQTYGKYSNIDKEYRARYNMKNEFMFAKLIIGDTKKRYMSSVLLREGNVMNPPKSDVKGFDFKKATCSEYAEAVYMGIINNRVLNSEQVDLPGMISDVYAFRSEVESSILAGEKKFLPNGNAKEIAGYKDPTRVQNVKAMLAWNAIHPENPIEPPCKMSLLKMNIFTIDDIAPLKESHPEIYERIVHHIFEDETGLFVKKEWIPTGVNYVYDKGPDWIKKIPPKYRKEYKAKGQKAWNAFVTDYEGGISNAGEWKYNCAGLLILGIPVNSDIPEWAIPYIDLKTMVNNILAPFVPVLKLFKFKTLVEGKSKAGVNRKTEGVSHMVKF